MERSPQSDGLAAFATLPGCVTDDLLQVIRLRTFPKGTVLFAQGGEPDAVFFVESGRVKWHTVTEDGDEQILQMVGPGQGAGLVALLDHLPYVGGAVAVEETQAWAVALTDFDRLVLRHPQLALWVMRQLGEPVRRLLEHVPAAVGRNAHERVAAVLARKAQPTIGEGPQVIPLTHQEIANLSGIARETASRVLADFQRRGAVRLGRSAVILLDATRLHGTDDGVKSS